MIGLATDVWYDMQIFVFGTKFDVHPATFELQLNITRHAPYTLSSIRPKKRKVRYVCGLSM